MKRVLVATDGSADAWAAVEDGVALASEANARVTFLTVRNPVSGLFGDPLYQRHLTRQLAHARSALEPPRRRPSAKGSGSNRRSSKEIRSDASSRQPAPGTPISWSSARAATARSPAPSSGACPAESSGTLRRR